MSRLDRHVSAVQNKLALDRFIGALAWASVFYAAAVWVGILVYKVLRVQPPHTKWWLIGGAGACVLFAFIWALIRRPTAHEAAVAIDEKLALKEKFSTALYARPMNDPFAQAAVKDAERTAENVSIHKRFPLEFPRQSIGTVGIAILVALTMAFVPKMDLFGREEKRTALAKQQARTDDARKAVEKAMQVIVQTEARGVADEETIKQAKKELEPLMRHGIKDPEQAKRSALKALSDLDNNLKTQIANNQKIADVESETKAFKSLTPPSDEKGPVADAQRKIAKGDFSEAIQDLSKAVDKFDQMSDEDKKKAADQMKQMANQLQQMAKNDPQAQQQAQQQMQQQLQQAGLNQQQAQQAAQLMQQAAQGDPKAQQQLQQAAQQAMQNMNAQQKQQAQQVMKQMQAQQNAQQQAQQMAQAAQQMAQAMQQAAQQGGQQGQQNAQQAGQNAQQMAQGKQQMQQQLGAMQAMKADAQQVAAAQAAAAQAAADAAAGMNGQGGQPGQQAGQGNWQGQGGQLRGNNQNKWNGQANNQHGPNQGGQGAGDRTFKEQAPYAVKEEISHSQDTEGGKILASTLIKAQSVKGESKVTAANVVAPPAQEATDEIEQERISRPAQQAVKEYFSAWQKDAAKQ